MECLQEVEDVKVVDLKKLVSGLAVFGYKEMSAPKPKKNFDFHSLDLRSLRIMNRLAKLILTHLELPLKQMRK
jgi:hypothetical protein